MTPIVKHGKYMSQINATPIYDDTVITIKNHDKGMMLYENDQLIAWLTFPVMKVVRGIRAMYPKAKLILI